MLRVIGGASFAGDRSACRPPSGVLANSAALPHREHERYEAPDAGLSSFLCGVSGLCCWVETSGVGDGERVKRSFPALGPGAEFTSSVVSDIADGQVEDLQNGVVGGEMPAGRSCAGNAARP